MRFAEPCSTSLAAAGGGRQARLIARSNALAEGGPFFTRVFAYWHETDYAMLLSVLPDRRS